MFVWNCSEQGMKVVALDNLTNSSPVSLQRVALLSNKPVELVVGDVRDASCLDRIFMDHHIDGVIHLAGLKAVGESVEKPSAYFDCNVYGTMMLVQAMERAGCQALCSVQQQLCTVSQTRFL